jgi:hypothetical protein
MVVNLKPFPKTLRPRWAQTVAAKYSGNLGQFGTGRGALKRTTKETEPEPKKDDRSSNMLALPTRDFLTLWKDADPDIPILKEAKAEYAKRVLSSESSRRVEVPLALK